MNISKDGARTVKIAINFRPDISEKGHTLASLKQVSFTTLVNTATEEYIKKYTGLLEKYDQLMELSKKGSLTDEN